MSQNQPVKCPKCGKEIDHLNGHMTEENLIAYHGVSGEYDHIENLSMNADYWLCPECYQRLDIGLDDDSADQFLKGEGA